MELVTDYHEQTYALQYLRPCAGAPFPMIPIYYQGNRYSHEMSVYTYFEAFPDRYNIFRTIDGIYVLRNLEKELLTACQYGHYDAVYELVSHKGLIINFQDEYGNTPLHYACWYMEQTGDPRMTALLLQCGANPVIYNHNGFFPTIRNPFTDSSAGAEELGKGDPVAEKEASLKNDA